MKRDLFQRGLLAALLLWLSAGSQGADRSPRETEDTVQFAAVHVYLDSGTQPLAAWQVSIKAANENIRIAGIEGGSHEAFEEPPFYDPKAMQRDQVILAAFNTGSATSLPRGRTRVATIHIQTRGTGEVTFETKLQAAANSDGRNIQAKVALEIVQP